MPDLSEDDFADDENAAFAEPPTDVMERLRTAARHAISLEELIADLEEQARRLKGELQKLCNYGIPDLMAETGQRSFTTTDGWKIKIEDFVSGTLPKDPFQKQRAIEWLDEHGAGDIIKTNISVFFDRNERELAQDVFKLLESYNRAALDPEMESNVHHQTLLAHARELLRNGEELPSLLGVYVGRIARITAPKAKKGQT